MRSVRGRALNALFIIYHYKTLLIKRKKWKFVALHNCYRVLPSLEGKMAGLFEKLSKHPKGFPHGVGCDEEIMRYMQFKHPHEIKADFLID